MESTKIEQDLYEKLTKEAEIFMFASKGLEHTMQKLTCRLHSKSVTLYGKLTIVPLHKWTEKKPQNQQMEYSVVFKELLLPRAWILEPTLDYEHNF